LGYVIFYKSDEQVYAFSKNHERCHLFAKEVNKTIQSKDEEEIKFSMKESEWVFQME
jgi:hypothetical protein